MQDTTAHSGLSLKQAAALEADKDVSIKAGAGSGKTRTITEKIFSIICRNYNAAAAEQDYEILGRILCISFTNKAAAELSERMLARFEAGIKKSGDEKFRSYLRQAAERLNELEILTLDAFFTKMLRRYAFLLSITPDFTPAAGGQSEILFRKAVFGVLDSLFMSGGQEGALDIFDDFYSFYRKKDKIHGLFSAILSRAVYIGRPLFRFSSRDEFERFVKTRIAEISREVKNIELDAVIGFAPFIEAMLYLNELTPGLAKATKEKAEGLLGLFEKARGGGEKARDDFFEYLACEYKNARYPKDADAKRLLELKDMLALASKIAKSHFGGENGPVEDAPLTAMEYDFFEGLCAIFDRCRDRYERLKKEMNLLDFNDIENLALESVSREEINRAVAGQYSHILIDEFQDTNDIQAGIIEKIKGRASLSIVGDGMQSIYRFRNANCSLFSKFEGMITSNGGLAVVLNDNYRSSANVLKFVNGFFEFLNFESDHPFSDFKYHPLNALSAAAENREIAVEAGIFPVINRKRSPQPPAAGCGEETPENSEAAEGGNADSENGPCEEEFDSGQFDFIARRAASLHREEGRKYGEMMILLSRMTHIDDLAGALSSAGVPFVISKSRKFFERPEILDMLNLAKSIADRDDDIAMAGLLRSPVFAVPDYILFALTESFRQNLKISGSESFSIYNALKSLRENKIDFREILNPEKISSSAYETEKARLVEIFEQINTYIQLSESLDAYGLLSFIYQDLNLSARYCRGDFGPASKNIEKLLAHIHENAFLPNGSIHDFLDNFQTAVDINFSEEESQCDSSSGDAVKIMTIHQAKGLEEKVVFVPELEADFFRAADNDIIVNSLHDIAFHPGAFVRLNERSILKNYYEAVKKYERYQELFEKKRLLYVATTRAKELLVLSASFKMSVGEDGPGKSAKIEKTPFILSGSHLNWLVNFLGLDAHFFAAAAAAEGDYRDLNTAHGIIRVFVKPPAAALPENEKTPAPSGSTESLIKWHEADFNIPPRICAEEYLRPRADIERPARITYSAYKTIAASLHSAPPRTAANENFTIGEGLLKIDAAEARGTAIGTAFHRAVQMVISSGRAVETFSKNLSSLAVKAYKSGFPVRYDPAVPAAVEKMLENFFNNLNKIGLEEILLRDDGGSIKKHCEIKMFHREKKFFLEGDCDLLTITGEGKALIYDFKTVSDAAAAAHRIKEYESQLAFYQLCASSHFSDIKSFAEPSVILIESAGLHKVASLKIALKTIEENQRLIIKNCGDIFG